MILGKCRLERGRGINCFSFKLSLLKLSERRRPPPASEMGVVDGKFSVSTAG